MTGNPSNQKKRAAEIMQEPALYCNNIEYHLNGFGLRLTFGEMSMLRGVSPTHRVAVFLPAAVIEPFMTGLQKVQEQQAAAVKAAAEQGPN